MQLERAICLHLLAQNQICHDIFFHFSAVSTITKMTVTSKWFGLGSSVLYELCGAFTYVWSSARGCGGVLGCESEIGCDASSSSPWSVSANGACLVM